MTSSRILHSLHARWQRLNRNWRQAYFRMLVGEPSLEIYFPIYIHPLKNVRIGKNVALGAFVHIIANERVTIGDNTIIASSVQLTTSTHDLAIRPYRSHRNDAAITIGRNVWIGAGAVILPGIEVGDNSVVGAGSVVTRNVPPNTLVVGSPARPVRDLTGFETD
jgi:maltose O-acetyltransferase